MGDRSITEFTCNDAAAKRGYLPIDLLVIAYMAITGILLLVSPHETPGRWPIAGMHLAGLALVAAVRWLPRKGGLWIRIVRHWYPLVLMPLFYWEVATLNRLIITSYFDHQIVVAEQWLFQSQPSQDLWRYLPWPVVSELLHFAYGLYEFLLIVIGLTFFILKRDEEFHRFFTSVFYTFFICYLLFILMPVRGPFHYFGPLVTDNCGLCCRLIHQLLGAASSEGTAFPSSHVAVSITVWLACRHSFPRLARVVLIIDIGIIIGTVYGGFHYAIDAIAGLIVGLGLGLQGPWVNNRLSGFLRLQGSPAGPD